METDAAGGDFALAYFFFFNFRTIFFTNRPRQDWNACIDPASPNQVPGTDVHTGTFRFTPFVVLVSGTHSCGIGTVTVTSCIGAAAQL